ncbi:MAG: hypothetical protein RI884_224 [Pseudomonadota bacterium]|jgi:hypothetical protein
MREEPAWAPVRRSWWHDDSTSLFNPRSIAISILVALTWAFSLIALRPNPPSGLPSSVASWSRICPNCGTIESVATLTFSPSEQATAPYRLTIRMADGSIRRIERPEPMVPGVQVLVQDDMAWPVPLANPAPAAPKRQ